MSPAPTATRGIISSVRGANDVAEEVARENHLGQSRVRATANEKTNCSLQERRWLSQCAAFRSSTAEFSLALSRTQQWRCGQPRRFDV